MTWKRFTVLGMEASSKNYSFYYYYYFSEQFCRKTSLDFRPVAQFVSDTVLQRFP